MNVNNLWLQLILGVIVLISPIWTLLKNYYDKFRIVIITDEIFWGIHEWDGDRYEIRYFIPIELINTSNSIGIVTDMRLKLKYHIKGPIYYFEYLSGDYELIPQNDEQFDFSARGDNLDTIVKNDFSSFVLKPKECHNKHILFRTFWNKLKLVDSFQVILEIQLNNKKWKKYMKWSGHLRQSDYNLYICGGGVISILAEKKSIWFLEKWRKYMGQKIHEKYDAEVNMKAIKVHESKSKW